MNHKETKQYSQEVLNRLQKALPDNRELFSEVSHLVVDLRKAAAKAPPAEADSYIREASALRHENEKLLKAGEQLKLDMQQQHSEWLQHISTQSKATLDNALATLKADYAREAERRLQVLDTVTLYQRKPRLLAFQPLDTDRVDIASTLIEFVGSLDTPNPQQQFTLPDGNVIVWTNTAEHFTGFVFTQSEFRKLSRASKMTRRQITQSVNYGLTDA